MDIKNLLKNLKLHETTISMILGAVVIVVTGILVVNYFAGRRGQTIPPVDIEETQSLPTTHTVQEGEDLWRISEKYYGSGYNWVDIASANSIVDPDQIVTGQQITIPAVTPKLALDEPTPQITTQVLEVSPTSIPLTPTEEKPELKVGKGVHKVVKGESLWKIAETYYDSGYNWVDIASTNKIGSPYTIEEGQEITIPEVEAKITTTKLTPQAISVESYTVVKGDSLWSIAVRAYGDGYRWGEIAKENHLINPGLIHPGNILTLPR